MQDIGSALSDIMLDKQCNAVCAFFLLSKKEEGQTDGVCKLQPKSSKKIGRRLCDKSHI